MRSVFAITVVAFSSIALSGPVLARGGGGHRNTPETGVSQSGDTVDVSDNHGGSVAQYDSMWAEIGALGKKVRVVGPCQSACTTLLGHVPRARICVTQEASFGFHKAHLGAMTDVMWKGYPADIKRWINDQGGLTPEFKWMHAPDTYRFFRQC